MAARKVVRHARSPAIVTAEVCYGACWCWPAACSCQAQGPYEWGLTYYHPGAAAVQA